MIVARSNYEVIFRPDEQISERVIFPVSENESAGIEDARFVRFVDDDKSVIYYATYTAYNGIDILPQILETTDFLTFRMHTLSGKEAQNVNTLPRLRCTQIPSIIVSIFDENSRRWEQVTGLRTNY